MKPSSQAVEEWAKSVASKNKRPLTEKEATEFIKYFMSQKALADAYGNNFYEAREEYPEVAGSTHKPYIFEIAGVKVNVWCVKEFTHSMPVEARGIRFPTLMSTLCRKMAYKRKKDSRDALSFASTLIEMSK